MSDILEDIDLVLEVNIRGAANEVGEAARKVASGVSRSYDFTKKHPKSVGGGAVATTGSGWLFYDHLKNSGISRKEISQDYISDFSKISDFYEHNYNFFKRNVNVFDTDISRLRDAFIERDPKAAQRLLEDLDTENFPQQSFESFKSVLKDLTDISLGSQYGNINIKSIKDFFGDGGIFTQDFNNSEIEKLVKTRIGDKLFSGDFSNAEVARVISEIPFNKESTEFFNERYGMGPGIWDTALQSRAGWWSNIKPEDVQDSREYLKSQAFDNDILTYLDMVEKNEVNTSEIFNKLSENSFKDGEKLEILKALDKKGVPFGEDPSVLKHFNDITVLSDNLDSFTTKNINSIIESDEFSNKLMELDSTIDVIKNLSVLDGYNENIATVIREKSKDDNYNDIIQYLSNENNVISDRDRIVDILFDGSDRGFLKTLFSSKQTDGLESIEGDNLNYLLSNHSGVESFKNYITTNIPPDISNENLKLLIDNFDNAALDLSNISSDRLLGFYSELTYKSDYTDFISENVIIKFSNSPEQSPETISNFIDLFGESKIDELYNSLGGISGFENNSTLLQKLLENANSDVMDKISTDLDFKKLQNIDFSTISSEKANEIFDGIGNQIDIASIFNNPNKYRSFIDSLSNENIESYFGELSGSNALKYISSEAFSNLSDNVKVKISDSLNTGEIIEGINENNISNILGVKSEEIKDELLRSLRLKLKDSDNEELIGKFNEISEEHGLNKINTLFDDIKDLVFSNYGLAAIILATGAGLVTAGLLHRNKKEKIQKTIFKMAKYYKMEEEVIYLISDVHYDFSNFFKKRIRNEREYRYELYKKFNKFKDYVSSHQNKSKIISDIESGKFFKLLDEYFYNKRRTSDINVTIANNMKTTTNYSSFKNEFFVDESIYF